MQNETHLLSYLHADLIEAGCDAGFDMTPITWDPRYKGIDDMLFAVKRNRCKNVEE